MVEATLAIHPHWTVDLLRQMPQVAGERYELIQGELHATTQSHTRHQIACTRLATELNNWSQPTGVGIAIGAPGLVYADNEAVAPDVVWVSHQRLAELLGDDGKLHGSPELIVEVLSPGKANEVRDRELKLELYARHGVREYWIADWRTSMISVYRWVEADFALVETLQSGEILTSPLLPGFACAVERLFALA
ncbi:Uma2 family endonuclease [Candidatus Chloroploca sp. Khr17]|uniref:Uma2 family endonuclease n=1 Tax=Candidatus Chloroploca sp. Khr17 TaxID=2496869 RepID=UPI00101D40F7|nr:Uma2 family endonuclease [Candidatus Chloroploca sp. Khr17]